MNLNGKQTYNTTPQHIWDLLMDTEKLAKITPGVSKLELIGEDQYNAISEIKIGPVKGAFKGDLFLIDKEEPTKFTLKVKQLSKIGNADATVNIHINELGGGQSELAFDGKAKLSGTLARTGQRVLTGVANTLTKQFFKALGEEIESSAPVASMIKEQEPSSKTPPEKIEIPEAIVKEKQTMLEEQKKQTPENTGLISWLKSLFGL